MAYYPNVWSYLNDQVREPFKKALKKGDKKEMMEILDFLILKYIELNAFAKGHEDFAKEKGVECTMPIQEYMKAYVNKYLPQEPIDWSKLELVYSSREEDVKDEKVCDA